MSNEAIHHWHSQMLQLRLSLWMLALVFLIGELGGDCFSIRLALLLFVGCLFGIMIDFSAVTNGHIS